MTVFCRLIHTRSFLYLLFSAAVFIGTAARAQETSAVDISDPNVTVDLSVLDDNGIGSGRAAAADGLAPLSGGFRLLVPGLKPPRSTLYIRPKGAVKLSPPAPAKKIVRKKPPRKKAKPAADTAMKTPPPPARIAPPPVPAGRKKAAPKQITAAPPPPPALKPMKAETKEETKTKEKPKKTAASAPKKLTPAPEKKKAPAKKAEKKPAKAKSGPPKAVAKIPAPAPRIPKKKEAVKKEIASLPPATTTPKTAAPAPGPPMGTALKIVFTVTTSKLPNQVKGKLVNLAGMLKGKDELRIQLLAYAGGKSLSSSKARRLSLSRALSVRSFLIGKGIRSTRIDVRALGNKTTEKPLNRVDVNVIKR